MLIHQRSKTRGSLREQLRSRNRSKGNMSDDPIGEACKILTTFKYCRAKAKALRKCQQSTSSKGGTGSSLFGANRNKCAREVSAFQTCANEKLERVIGDLVQIAYKKCPAEAQAFEACKRTTMSDSACEALDQRMMECASRMVIRSVHQK